MNVCTQPADENNSLTLGGETPPLLRTPYFQVKSRDKTYGYS